MKYQEAYAMLADTLAALPEAGKWADFLQTASAVYRYPFLDQVMIYAQRPNATACATYDDWNQKMHCYIRRGTTGIALIDAAGRTYPKLKYIFDVADTIPQKEIGRTPNLWVMHNPDIESVISRLETLYGETDRELPFPERIRMISESIAEDNIDRLSALIDQAGGISDDPLVPTKQRIQSTLSESVRYMILTRCNLGIGIPELEEAFPFIGDFQDIGALKLLGSASSSLAMPVLREIGKTVQKNRQNEQDNLQKTIAKASTIEYNTLKHESAISNQNYPGSVK